MSNTNWYPEIMYEEDSKIPFVPVPKDEQMPGLLFMFESRETGEFEPDHDGNPLPIVQMDLHQYANMSTLKDTLSPAIFDEVRISFGLEPLLAAAEKGNKITNNIKNTLKK
ncbi:MAG: hypothetical protein H8E12_10530 [Rhodobacteraceae bacterium]|nr:hypothetical protein [Paracoccaceae bacterium]